MKHVYNINKIELPSHLKTKNEKLSYIFNFLLRYLQSRLKIIEQNRQDIYNEFEKFSIQPTDNENLYSQQFVFIQNELQINEKKKLLKFIKKFKSLLKKLQYDFLYSKFDRFYEILVHTHQISLPPKTDIPLIRDTLADIKKQLKKDIRNLDSTRIELMRTLDLLKTKEELKQRTKITPATEVNIIKTI